MAMANTSRHNVLKFLLPTGRCSNQVHIASNGTPPTPILSMQMKPKAQKSYHTDNQRRALPPRETTLGYKRWPSVTHCAAAVQVVQD